MRFGDAVSRGSYGSCALFARVARSCRACGRSRQSWWSMSNVVAALNPAAAGPTAGLSGRRWRGRWPVERGAAAGRAGHGASEAARSPCCARAQVATACLATAPRAAGGLSGVGCACALAVSSGRSAWFARCSLGLRSASLRRTWLLWRRAPSGGGLSAPVGLAPAPGCASAAMAAASAAADAVDRTARRIEMRSNKEVY